MSTILLLVIIWLLIGFVSSILVTVGYYITTDRFTLADAVMIVVLTLLGIISFMFFIGEFSSDMYFWADKKVIFRRKERS